MHLLVTIDTEGDNAWAGKGYEDHTHNARFLPRFHRLCVRHGFKPTYLTTYEMAGDEFFAAFARRALAAGECEIGAHPHPWNQPPEHAITADDRRWHPYLIEYPEDIIREKVRVLTERLCDRFEVPMRAHRAGRWALSPAYARVLAELEYLVDCSVTPRDHGVITDRPPPHHARVPLPDYGDFPATPYFLGSQSISTGGDLPVLELPMTIVPRYPRPLAGIYWSLPRGTPRRLVRAALGQPVSWFRPTRKNERDLLRVAERRLQEGAGYLMFMLHSSELMPAGSPTFKTQADIEELYNLLESVFSWLRRHGVDGATLSEYRAIHLGEARP